MTRTHKVGPFRSLLVWLQIIAVLKLLGLVSVRGAFISDDFSGGGINGGLWTIENPVGDGTVEVSDDVLRLSVPAGSDHNVWTGGNRSVRVMQPVSNTDFEIEAKFQSVVQVSSQVQGFLVEQDPANYLRFDVYHDGASVRVFGASIVNGTASAKFNRIITAGLAYYLRLKRQAGTWTFTYSYDGSIWRSGGSISRTMIVGRVGVFAGNAVGSASPAFTAAVDYVFNTASPIEPEDGVQGTVSATVSGLGTVKKNPDRASYKVGQIVELTAIPAAGWSFGQWSGELSGTPNPIYLTVQKEHALVTARFVVPNNTAPSISTVGDQVINEDAPVGPIAFSVGDAHSPPEMLVVTGSSSNEALVPAGNILIGGAGANRTVAVTPFPNRYGTAVITLRANDGEHTTEETFTVVVNPVNDAPTISSVGNQNVASGEIAGPIAFTIGDSEAAAESLSVNKNSSNPALVPVTNITLGGSGVNRTVTIVPAAGQEGTATVTLTVSDGESSSQSSFAISVTPPKGPFVSDDFSGALGAVWQFMDPVGDSIVEMGGNLLRIHVPGGVDHDVWSTGNRAPRLMQTVSNTDFECEVRFESAVTDKYQMQGLIVEQDATNFLRINVHSDGAGPRLFVAAISGATATKLINKAIAENPIYYLRVKRLGTNWNVSYSNNGSTWSAGGTFTRSIVVNQMGVFAGNAAGATSPDFTAIVDYVFNTATPIEPEDGGDGAIVTSVSGNGRIIRNPDQVYYDVGQQVELVAVPEPGWVFTKWSGDLSGNANPADIAVAGDKLVQAQFLPSDPSAAIDIWYGDHQRFGGLGIPQSQVNILGNISIAEQIQSLSYSLNGAPRGALSFLPQQNIRIARIGDFNAEIPFSALIPGLNHVTLTAVHKDGIQFTKNITVEHVPGNTWPEAYSIDWSAVTNPQTVAQIVDGKWSIGPSGIRSVEPHYDRLVAIGDISWSDYEVRVPITVNDVFHEVPGNAPCVGVLLRWDGHIKASSSEQPGTVWWPIGAIGMHRWYSDALGPRFQIYENTGSRLIRDTSRQSMEIGARYIFKMRVQTISGQNAGHYSFKYWRDGQPEPASWNLIDQAETGLSNGSLVLLSHFADATFGNITVTPIFGP